jgi:hypothetical protein
VSQLAEEAAKYAESSDTKKLSVVEKEIDSIVYELFGLTPEEIEIIEKSYL